MMKPDLRSKVIVPDINLLIYPIDSDSLFHEKASAWLESALAGSETVGFVWNVLPGFLRIAMRSSLPTALTVEQAFGLLSL